MSIEITKRTAIHLLIIVGVLFALFYSMNMKVVNTHKANLVLSFHDKIQYVHESTLSCDKLYYSHDILKLVYEDGVLIDAPRNYPKELVFDYKSYDDSELCRDYVGYFVHKAYEEGNRLTLYKMSIYKVDYTDQPFVTLSTISFAIMLYAMFKMYFTMHYDRTNNREKLTSALQTQLFSDDLVDNTFELYHVAQERTDMNELYRRFLSHGAKTAMFIFNKQLDLLFYNKRAEQFVVDEFSFDHLFQREDIKGILNRMLLTTREHGEIEIDERIYMYTSYRDYFNTRYYYAIHLTDITESVRYKNNQISFFNQASHELRTPLTSILGYVELMKMCELDETTNKRIVSSCFEECKKMDLLIASIINLSKRFKIDDAFSKVKMSDLVKSCLSEISGFYDHSVTLDLDMKVSLLCNADKSRLAIYHVIKNAFVHNIPDGYVDIKLENKHSAIELVVTNPTFDMTEEQISKLNEPFYKCRNPYTGHYGVGLGLSLASAICDGYNYVLKYKCENNIFEVRVAFYLDRSKEI